MHYYIVPGYGGTPDAAWYAWLKGGIKENTGSPVTIIDVPKTQMADSNVWQTVLEQTIDVNQSICLIAHSFGCYNSLRFIMDNEVRPDALLMVGAFAQPLTVYPELTPALSQHQLDFNKLRRLIRNGLVLTALDDPVVPWMQAQKIAENLRLDVLIKASGGHFVGRRAPLVAQALQAVVREIDVNNS
ncbi:putative alpha/beta hydrolase family esterase [Weissella uvarum]|uniref:alpha/beta hydrolase n=1 Tax=Weissella uvarum TaxID=1479233 RepID=UPI00195F4E61|nr:alpha/beta hydrolase [Weissella uvarum]MBM7616538.1 putative alpha/beta hydrolase family esterase [Weissella uvarum]MCM0595001.1 alpha/beta hydrolase [Weissella uvarum]